MVRGRDAGSGPRGKGARRAAAGPAAAGRRASPETLAPPRESPVAAARAALSMIRAVAAYTLLEALRQRLWRLAGACIGTAFVVAEFAGAVAVAESEATRTLLLGAMMRGGAVLALSLVVITGMAREWHDKVPELMLSQPRPRAAYYFGKLAGFSALALAGALLCGLCLLPYAPPAAVLPWSASLAMELAIVVALSLFTALTFAQVTPAFGVVLACYLLARGAGALVLASRSSFATPAGLPQSLVEALAGALGVLLPDLGRFTASEWLLRPPEGLAELPALALRTLACLALLAGASLFDLYRKSL